MDAMGAYDQVLWGTNYFWKSDYPLSAHLLITKLEIEYYPDNLSPNNVTFCVKDNCYVNLIKNFPLNQLTIGN